MQLAEVTPPHYEFFCSLYRDVLPWAASTITVTSYSPESELMAPNTLWRVFLDGDEQVGICGLKNLNLADRAGEPVVAIHPAHRRTGYGLSMSRQLIHLAFNELNLNRLCTIVLADALSIHLLEQTGFAREGQLRQARYKNGKYVDTLVYGLLREEYKWAA
jgi:RimJ/RimL family protein N-acetyltransferase